MVLENATQVAPLIAQHFSRADAIAAAKPLALYVFGIAIYAIFIFKFYRFLAKKDVFELDLGKYSQTSFAGAKKFFSVVSYVVKYLLVFPLVVFMWFAFLGILLIFLAKTGSVEQLLLISVSLVGAVRVCAYYNENLSQDLAKMLPLALLGITMLDVSYFNLMRSLEMLFSLFDYWKLLSYYFVFIVGLEFVLRIFSGAVHLVLPEKKGK
ncbi:hypothetical protein ACFLQI_02970 [Candidatus Undinarchaeota archaeon]